jgi:hypothetical protein
MVTTIANAALRTAGANTDVIYHSTMSRTAFAGLLAAGLLVRLAVLSLRGTSDVPFWKTWTANAARGAAVLRAGGRSRSTVPPGVLGDQRVVGLNVVLFYGFGRDLPRFYRASLGFDLTVLLAAANLGLFAWITWRNCDD